MPPPKVTSGRSTIIEWHLEDTRDLKRLNTARERAGLSWRETVLYMWRQVGRRLPTKGDGNDGNRRATHSP